MAPDGSWRVGCIICRKAGYTATSYGSFPRATMALLRGWKKHSKQPCHVAASQGLEGAETAESRAAPSPAEFKSLWMALRKNRQDVEEAASPIFRAKARKMLYCLAEAVRSRQRRHLRGSSCMTLSLDACKTRLLCRYTAVTSSLETQSGILGCYRSKATGHKAVLHGVETVYRAASTALHDPPLEPRKNEAKAPPSFDEDLYEHLRKITRVWNSDAGPDEMLAAQESERVQVSVDDVRPLLPKLALINRDKAHASRRVAQRPWLSSDHAKAVFTTFTKWFSTVEHSNLLRGWYEQFQIEQGNSQHVKIQKSLSFAAHRFDSSSKPFAVCLLTFPSVILTAIKAVSERKNDPSGIEGKAFLEFISGHEGARRIVLAGMLADAADEALLLTRAFDKESTDIALIHAEIQQFMRNVKLLFVDQQCVELGFTALALEQVKQPYVYFPENAPVSIGLTRGISAPVLQTCLQHMAAWTAVAVKVIETEFPSFDLMLGFRVFALSGMESRKQKRDQCLRRAHHHSDDLGRICKALQVDEATCSEEFAQLVGIAEAQQATLQCSNFEAWKSAVQVTQRSRGNYPLTALIHVLEAYGAWTCSTSGVEQNFSVRDHMTCKRSPIGPQHELDHLQIHVSSLAVLLFYCFLRE